MSIGDLTEVMKDAVLTAATVAGPILLLSIVIGLVIAILQAATSINEQTLTFVPKIIIVALVLVFGGGWMLQKLVDFTNRIFELIATMG